MDDPDIAYKQYLLAHALVRAGGAPTITAASPVDVCAAVAIAVADTKATHVRIRPRSEVLKEVAGLLGKET